MDRIENVVLPAEMERLLPQELSDREAEGYLDDIRHAFGVYHWELKDGPNQFTRAEASASIKELIKANVVDRKAIHKLNQRAFNLVYDMVQDVGTQTRMLMLASTRCDETIDHDEILSAADRALKLLAVQGGPEKPFPLSDLVQTLCNIYEAAFERPVKHHTKIQHRAYSQEAQTHAGKFVTAAIQMLHPEIANTTINRCLGGFVRHREKTRGGTDSSDF